MLWSKSGWAQSALSKLQETITPNTINFGRNKVMTQQHNTKNRNKAHTDNADGQNESGEEGEKEVHAHDFEVDGRARGDALKHGQRCTGTHTSSATTVRQHEALVVKDERQIEMQRIMAKKTYLE